MSQFRAFWGFSGFPCKRRTGPQSRRRGVPTAGGVLSCLPELEGDNQGIPLPSPQPPLNAQMLAQRQRELYSQQHRQRQLMQQRAILMRQQSFGNNLPPSGGLPVQIGAARLPQAPPQQFPYPPNYGTTPGNPPTSTSPFSPLASNPEAAALANRSSMVNRGMMGGVGGQFGAGMTPQMQQNIFQYSGSGTLSSWLHWKAMWLHPAISPGLRAGLVSGFHLPRGPILVESR